MQRMGKKQQLIVRRGFAKGLKKICADEPPATLPSVIYCLVCSNGYGGLGDWHLLD